MKSNGAIYNLFVRFHNGVTRCYCPSEEVSKRASLEGLEPSQIRVFGLPIRPSFCRAILNKVQLCLIGEESLSLTRLGNYKKYMHNRVT